MRVLYANHTSHVSGGEHSLLALLDALPAEVEPILACPPGPLADLARARDIEVRRLHGTEGSLRLHPLRTPRALAEMALAGLRLRAIAASLGADLLHANSIRAGIAGAAARAAGGPATIVHVRDCLPAGPVAALALCAIEHSDAVIANSAHTRSTLGGRRTEVRVIHNAVELDRYDPANLSRGEARTRLGIDEHVPVLAVVAQITPWKAQDDAIRIAAELRRDHPGLRLLLVGSPKFDSPATRHDNSSYLAVLHRLVRELALEDCVAFLGERQNVPEILRAVDLLLVPSWEEPFGRTIIEAMAAGVPVAVTNVGGPPEIVGDSRCGLLLPPRQPQRWAAALARLLADPVRLAEMGGRGRDAARSFGPERHATDVLEIYRSVLGDAGASGC